MKRLWTADGMVWGESCLFLEDGTVRLAFSPEEITAVRNADGSELYIPGRDYAMTQDGMRRIPGGRIPAMSLDQLYPDPSSCSLYPAKDCTAIAGGPDGKAIFFARGMEYMNRQVWVDYKTARLDFPLPPPAGKPFRKMMVERLKTASSFRVTFIGDSITEGLNSSLKCGVPPMQPPYPELVCAELERLYRIHVDGRNRGVGGSGCQNAAKIKDDWCADAPDLLVVAYGMNNFASMTAEQFMDTIKDIIRDARNARPDTAVLLVASMEGNRLWGHTPPEPAKKYAEALREYAAQQEDIGLADMYSAWKELVRRKNYYDLAGNGVNHPNDYGYRVYASIILNELTDGQYLQSQQQ